VLKVGGAVTGLGRRRPFVKHCSATLSARNLLVRLRPGHGDIAPNNAVQPIGQSLESGRGVRHFVRRRWVVRCRSACGSGALKSDVRLKAGVDCGRTAYALNRYDPKAAAPGRLIRILSNIGILL
jgi:hypothetical protein